MNNHQFPREMTLKFGSKKIAARQWGSTSGAPVLALHGWLDNCASFDRLSPMLGDIHLVAIDMAGHGQSYHRSADANYNLLSEVEDILGVMDSLGWQRCALLGHSRGAIVAMLTAGAFPERIKRLALIDGLIPAPTEDCQAPFILAKGIIQRKRYWEREPRFFATIDQAVSARQNGLFQLDGDAARRLVERGVRAYNGGYTWSNDPQLLSSSSVKLNLNQINAFLDKAAMPIRLVLAENGIEDMIQRLKPLVEYRENIELREIPGGHHLHMQAEAEGIANWFRPFLHLP